MTALEYVGKAITNKDSTVAYRRYVSDKAATSLTHAQVDSRVAQLLSGYATKMEVDVGDAGAVTLAYVDSQDALRIPLSWKGTPNGVATLTAGRVTPDQIVATGEQRFIKKMYSPSSYGSQQSVTSGTVTLYTVTIQNPGFAYRCQAWGFANVTTSLSTGSASISVRLGSSSGATISRGIARMSSAGWSECTFVPIYSGGDPLTGNTTLYVVGQRSAGSGTVTIASLLANVYIQVLPA